MRRQIVIATVAASIVAAACLCALSAYADTRNLCSMSPARGLTPLPG